MGRPSAGGLNFPEYVVYRGEQVILVLRHFDLFLLIPFCQAYPEYLITYQIVKPEEESTTDVDSR